MNSQLVTEPVFSRTWVSSGYRFGALGAVSPGGVQASYVVSCSLPTLWAPLATLFTLQA